MPISHQKSQGITRDVKLLLVGAAISVTSSLLTGFAQYSLQRQQIRADRQLTILRECVDFQTQTTAHALQILDRAEEATRAAIAEVGKNGKVSLDTQSNFTRLLLEVRDVRLTYEAKVEALATMQHAAFGPTIIDLRIRDRSTKAIAPPAPDITQLNKQGNLGSHQSIDVYKAAINEIAYERRVIESERLRMNADFSALANSISQ